MPKTKEELTQLKNEYETLNKKLKELTDEELKEVTGGNQNPTLLTNEPSTDCSSIVGRAQSCLGQPYVWGTVGPNGYDDSGLVSYCLSGVHSRIGNCSTFMSWPRVSNPEPGDVCVSANHCGIYVGGGQMIHAPSIGYNVCYSSVQSGMIFVRQP